MVEGVDLAITEIPDKQVAAVLAETGGRYIEPPGRVESTADGDVGDEVSYSYRTHRQTRYSSRADRRRRPSARHK